MKKIFLFLIHLYQWTLPVLLPSQCRFIPSCSHYAQEAIEKNGLFGGGQQALRRILRCHRWGGSGYDPIVVNKKNREAI